MSKEINEFNTKGYTLIKEAITKELVEHITQYALFDEMQDFAPEKINGNNQQVPEAHSKYGDACMESLLLSVKPLIEKYTGISVYPTYSYYRVYRNGDELKHHTDRPSCEISTTVSFNFSYQDSNYRWPIFIDGTPIYMEPGDMAIYRGIDLDHWREPLEYPEDVWHVQAFLHYVDINGPHVDWKFDKRDSIGQIKKSSTPFIQASNPSSNKSYIKYL